MNAPSPQSTPTEVSSQVSASDHSPIRIVTAASLFDGHDAADVIWAMQDRNIWSADRAAQMGSAGHTGFGHYRERYVRCTDGAWRISHQRLSYVHMDFY